MAVSLRELIAYLAGCATGIIATVAFLFACLWLVPWLGGEGDRSHEASGRESPDDPTALLKPGL